MIRGEVFTMCPYVACHFPTKTYLVVDYCPRVGERMPSIYQNILWTLQEQYLRFG